MSRIYYGKREKIKADLIIADRVLADLYPEQFDEDTVFLKAGEKAKSFKNIKKLIRVMAERGLDRHSRVIIYGGGTITDMASFVSSIYMRGIRHDIVPTTFLGMVDASIGGKTGINFNGTKNLVGSFYEPENIYIDTDFILTESNWSFKNGAVEAIKMALLFNYKLFLKIENKMEDFVDSNKKISLARALVRFSSEQKQIITSNDLKENNFRVLLNAGHTVAHALEIASDYSISHGKAVAIGLIIEHRLAGYEDISDRLSSIFSKLFEEDMEYEIKSIRHMELDFSNDKKSDGNNIILPLVKIENGKSSPFLASVDKKEFENAIKLL